LKLLEFLTEIVYFCAFLKNINIKIYRTSILVIVFYGCETWSLTVKEESKPRLLDNRVLRRIFGPKTDGITGQWRKLHNEELNDLYFSPNIVREIKSRIVRWAGHVERVGSLDTGILTGHNTLRRHPHLMGLIDSPLCWKCGAHNETSVHILCRCEALASLRHAYLGSFLEPEYIKNVSLGAIWNFGKATGRP
jgi:hypothetical protein